MVFLVFAWVVIYRDGFSAFLFVFCCVYIIYELSRDLIERLSSIDNLD